MKLFVILFAIVAVVPALKQEPFLITKELTEKMNVNAKPCAEKYKVDIETVKGIVDGTFPRNDATYNFIYCFGLNGGYLQEDGHVVVERMAKIIGNHPLAEELKESIKKCNEVTKENPIATTLAMNDCFVKTAPIRFVF